MAKKFKIDKDKLKQLLMQKVEVVGVGAAGVLALLLLVVGLMSAFGSGSPAAGIRASNQSLDTQLKSTAGPTEDDTKKDKLATRAEWPHTPLNAFPTAPWYDAASAGDPKKRNPTVRGLEVVTQDGKGNLTQVTAYSGGVFMYQVDVRNNKIMAVVRLEDVAAKTPGQPVQQVRTEHLALVEGVFPYREQLKDYLKALRVEQVEELVAKNLTPEFAGLNVYRGEILRDGTVKDWKPVYLHDKDGKVTMSPAVERLLKEGVYDQTRIEQCLQYLPPDGGDTPFLKPVVGVYPPLKIEGLTLPEVEAPPEVAGGNPDSGTSPPGQGGISLPGPPTSAMLMGKGKGTPPGMGKQPEEDKGGKLRAIPLKSYPKAFAERVMGKLNPFNVYGVFEPAREDGKQGSASYKPGNLMPEGALPGGGPGMTSGAKSLYQSKMGGSKTGPVPGEGAPKTAETPDGLSDKMVLRFVDAGLEPGKAYQYYVQVRLKNPNFGKTKEVAFPAMAEKKVLESPWVLTQPVYVPPDISFYFVNQSPLVSSKKIKGGNDRDENIPAGKIPVQIHQLIDDSSPSEETSQKVGDWVVAERLLIGRGDLIARRHVQVEVPYWNPVANAFTLGSMVRIGKRLVPKDSIPVDFGDESSPVLADFWGGKVKEANVEALVLTADGRLAVRSSHEDSDPESDIGKERLHRYDAWRARLESVRNAGRSSVAGPGPTIPKGGRPID